MEQEIWKTVDEFPNYEVSNKGRIVHASTERIKQTSINAQGIVMIAFFEGGRQNVRSLPLVVANHFLSRDDVPEIFNTPIHLNGDKTDCRVSNLMWRPRWFAVKYHKQFEYEDFGKHAFKQPIQLMETGEVYENTWDAAMELGLIEVDIVVDTLNGNPTFPDWYHFELTE